MQSIINGCVSIILFLFLSFVRGGYVPALGTPKFKEIPCKHLLARDFLFLKSLKFKVLFGATANGEFGATRLSTHGNASR